MSRLTTGISGAVALAVISCAAAQFALGRDLAAAQDHAQPQQGHTHPQTDRLAYSFTTLAAVNRGAKADRAASPAGSSAPTRTVSLRFDGFSATTFLLRVPQTGGNRSLAVPPAKLGARKPMVACEPVVSVLTEVVKQLEPGRCVT
jgi:hypothetical protein